MAQGLFKSSLTLFLDLTPIILVITQYKVLFWPVLSSNTKQ